MVDGKRRHTTSLINNLSRISGGSTPVDIDLIPTNAVGRVEVLRDGAAARHGSDAVSEVINCSRGPQTTTPPRRAAIVVLWCWLRGQDLTAVELGFA